MKKKILIRIDILLIVLTVIFILSNSSTPADKSNATSEDITDKVIENVKPLEDAVAQEKIERDDVHKFVRKTAHVLEYALLGAEMMLLLLLLFPQNPMKYLIYALFFGLFLGVCDESVQKLIDRTSNTADILRDFCGVCFGMTVAYLISLAVLSIVRKIKEKRSHVKA